MKRPGSVSAQLRAGLVADYERGADPRPLLALLRRGRRMALVKVRPASQEDGPVAIAEALSLAPLLAADEALLCTGGLVLNAEVPEDDPRRIDRRIVLEMRVVRDASPIMGRATTWDPEAGVGDAVAIRVDQDQPVPLALRWAVQGRQVLPVAGYALAAAWRLTSAGHSIVITPAATGRLARNS